MPTINFPPHVRFVLYLVGAIALIGVGYAVDKTWAGDAEVRLVTALAALINLLAAAKTDLSGATPTPVRDGLFDERGATDTQTLIFVVLTLGVASLVIAILLL